MGIHLDVWHFSMVEAVGHQSPDFKRRFFMGMFLAFDEVPSANSSGIKFLDDYHYIRAGVWAATVRRT